LLNGAGVLIGRVDQRVQRVCAGQQPSGTLLVRRAAEPSATAMMLAA